LLDLKPTYLPHKFNAIIQTTQINIINMNTNTPRDVLTPASLSMLQVIADTGSFAAAARSLNMVPSALTYRVRQIEDALDV